MHGDPFLPTPLQHDSRWASWRRQTTCGNWPRKHDLELLYHFTNCRTYFWVRDLGVTSCRSKERVSSGCLPQRRSHSHSASCCSSMPSLSQDQGDPRLPWPRPWSLRVNLSIHPCIHARPFVLWAKRPVKEASQQLSKEHGALSELYDLNSDAPCLVLGACGQVRYAAYGNSACCHHLEQLQLCADDFLLLDPWWYAGSICFSKSRCCWLFMGFHAGRHSQRYHVLPWLLGVRDDDNCVRNHRCWTVSRASDTNEHERDEFYDWYGTSVSCLHGLRKQDRRARPRGSQPQLPSYRVMHNRFNLSGNYLSLRIPVWIFIDHD